MFSLKYKINYITQDQDPLRLTKQLFKSYIRIKNSKIDKINENILNSNIDKNSMLYI